MRNHVLAKIGPIMATQDRFMRELCSMVAKIPPSKGSKESLGQRLARLRKARGMTQVELAQQVGLSQPNISEYERDTFRPNSDTLLSLAQVLKVSADELLGHRVSAKEVPRVSRKLMRRMEEIEKLPATDQRALLKTIDTFLKGAQA
jgi:transcriptional regulator with XRE-family HTH domain